ncbi:MAG: aminotransferase class IV [Pseudomonadota bacterium]|nr:aminotransferase class IV [Pseudomonadota bacterium]
MTQERVAYINGDYLPESEVKVSFRDRGFVLGDAVFDTARTFEGKIFRLDDHIDRLYRSLKAVDMDPGVLPEEMAQISQSVVEKNRPLLGKDNDYWVFQRVTRGAKSIAGDSQTDSGATVIVECTPLPLKARAPMFRDGIDVLTPVTRRIPPECLSPNIKNVNYMNLVLAEEEVKGKAEHPWAVLLDTRGFLCEGIGSNIFLMRDGTLFTPRPQFVLEGVSRQIVIDLAGDLGIPVSEEDLTTFQAETADEAFMTSTSLCLCPARSYNGKMLGDGQVPGPVTTQLTAAFSELVGYDFVGQYLRTLKTA